MHVAGVRADAATFEHVDPEVVGNARELLVSELAGKRTVAEKAQAPASSSTTTAPRASSSASRSSSTAATSSRPPTAPSSCCCARRPATYEPLFRLESWRVIVEQRADGKVETEATIKIWVDGERYVRTAEGNGPVNALDAALRAAIARDPPAPGATIELVNYKVRILDETPRHRRGHARAHRRRRRPRRLGLDRRPRERHRRLLAGAGRLAGVRRAARRPRAGRAARGAAP